MKLALNGNADPAVVFTFDNGWQAVVDMSPEGNTITVVPARIYEAPTGFKAVVNWVRDHAGGLTPQHAIDAHIYFPNIRNDETLFRILDNVRRRPVEDGQARVNADIMAAAKRGAER